jgi:hypothetical protein
VAKGDKNTHGTECIKCVDVFNRFPQKTIMQFYFSRILPDLPSVEAIVAHVANNMTVTLHSITTNVRKELLEQVETAFKFSETIL